jgi:hypothetical protein
MALKIALPIPALPKFDPVTVAQTRARLVAWWDGTDPPDLDAIKAEIEAQDGPGKLSAKHKKLYVTASHIMWGPDRNFPTSLDLTTQLGTAVGAKKDATMACLGAGSGLISRSLLEQFGVKLTAYESDPTIRSLAGKAVKKSKARKGYTAKPYNGQLSGLAERQAELAMLWFQGGGAERAERGAFTILRLLKPGGQAIWFDLFSTEGEASPDLAKGIENRSFTPVEVFKDAAQAAGLTVVSEAECNLNFLAAISSCWSLIGKDFDKRQAALIKAGGQEAASLALHSIVTWKARAAAVRAGQLSARYIVVSAPA